MKENTPEGCSNANFSKASAGLNEAHRKRMLAPGIHEGLVLGICYKTNKINNKNIYIYKYNVIRGMSNNSTL